MSPNRRRDASATCAKIALAQVNEAILLAASKERNAPASIHELRRISKRLRSLWRLVRPFAAEKNLSKEADKTLRASARLLSRHRDAHIVRKTLRRIERNAKTDSERKAVERVIEALKTLISQKVAPRLPDIRWGKISKTLQQEAERWKTLQEQGENDWREGVVQTYRKGRRLASRAFADNRPFLEKMGQIPRNPTRRAVRKRTGSGFEVAEKDCAVGGTIGQLPRFRQRAANGARAFRNRRRLSDGAMFLSNCLAHGVPGDSAFPKTL